jgi:DNA-binding MarR family transcriptional regulator
MHGAQTLIIPLLQAFFWFDDGLQAYLQARGWTEVTRPESMVMASVIVGIHKPSEIARSLGVTRQSIHATINQMVARGMLALVTDPSDGRAKLVVLSEVGQSMRKDADSAIGDLVNELRRRIGTRNVENLIKAFSADWGASPVAEAQALAKRLP